MRSSIANALLLVLCTLAVIVAPRLVFRDLPQAPRAVAVAAPATASPGVEVLVASPTVETRVANHLWSDGRGEVWVAGGAGRLLRSRDHGQSFAPVTPPAREDLVGVTGRQGGPIVVATAGAIYRTGDGGASWARAVSFVPGEDEDEDAEAGFTGLYADGDRLWVTSRIGDERMHAVARMSLLGGPLTLLPGRYDEIDQIFGRRGQPLLLVTVYNCGRGDHPEVERLLDDGTSAQVESGVDAFARSAAPIKAAHLTPDGDLYLLGVDDDREMTLLRRRRGERVFQRTPIEGEAIWAGDDGEVFIAEQGDRLRRSRDHGATFGPPIAL